MSDSVRPHRPQPTRLPSSLGFSRQEHWSGLPFPSPMHERKSESEVAHSCLTLSDPMDCSPPGSSVHGIFPGKSTGVGCHCLLRLDLLVLRKTKQNKKKPRAMMPKGENNGKHNHRCSFIHLVVTLKKKKKVYRNR